MRLASAVGWSLCLAAGLLLAPGDARSQSDPAQYERLVTKGKSVYEKYCIGCHGVEGDGQGPAADMLIVKPRDFTSGVFKFRSTPSGTLPTDEDLYKTITRGVYRTSMPRHTLVPEQERIAVIQYIKTFSSRFRTEGAGEPIVLPSPPDFLGTPASVQRGRAVYELLECGNCHGDRGLGDGPSSKTMAPDAWGHPQKPFNFTRGWLKSGPTAKDIYRTFMTGLNGTAMPSYASIFENPDGEYILEGDAWHLISYILSLRTSGLTANQ